MDTVTIPLAQYLELLWVVGAAKAMRRLEKWNEKTGGHAADTVAVAQRLFDEALAALDKAGEAP